MTRDAFENWSASMDSRHVSAILTVAGWASNNPTVCIGDVISIEGVRRKRRWWLLWEFWCLAMPLKNFTVRAVSGSTLTL